MSINKDIQELIDAEIITRETADRIQQYYAGKVGNTQRKLIIAFGILGAVLVGLGIILILAHNWDELARSTKTVLAFIPLIIGQVFCGLTLAKYNDSSAWREASSTFLFFAVGASISLVSQIYHIVGELSDFMFIWSALALPIIYIMRSSMASLLYICAITFYGDQVGYWTNSGAENYTYWLLLLAAAPYYYLILRDKPNSNFTIYHHWFIPLSVINILGTVAYQNDAIMYVSYMSLFGTLYIIGNSNYFSEKKFFVNAPKILGSLGTVIIALILSFNWFWKELISKEFSSNVFISPEFIVAVVLSLIGIILFSIQSRKKQILPFVALEIVFILFIIIFILGIYLPYSQILINLLVFGIGILYILEGAKKDHLGVLNYGLLIITALIICRFFDSEISFITRGILFVLVGAGFFFANVRMLKKRRVPNEQ
jgi:uncharacterized membrane protein